MQRRIDKRAIRAGKPRLESWGLALEGPYARFDGFDHNSGRSAKSSALRRVPVRVWCGLGRREAWVRIPPPQPLSRGQSTSQKILIAPFGDWRREKSSR